MQVSYYDYRDYSRDWYCHFRGYGYGYGYRVYGV
jgi:hypothetical protein